jgi:hypothetical protein
LLTSRQAPEADITRLLQAHAPDVRALVEQLRTFVLQAVTAAQESANFGWHSLNYRHPQQGYFCGIFLQETDAKLVFEYGVLLPDDTGLLQGEGKQVRFMLLTAGEPLPAAALRQYLLAALDLPVKKSEKMALIQAGVRWRDEGE